MKLNEHVSPNAIPILSVPTVDLEHRVGLVSIRQRQRGDDQTADAAVPHHWRPAL